MNGSFGGAGYSNNLLIKPGEELQYMIEMVGATEGIGRVRLQYTQDGGLRWITETDLNGTNIDATGTALDPLVGTEYLGWVKNETPKNKLYRWHCVSMDRATSAVIPWHLSNHIQPVKELKFGAYLYVNDEAPEGGTDGDGAGLAGKGSIYIDTSGGHVYRNDGTSAMPIWSDLG